jgi:hypothetical protein
MSAPTVVREWNIQGLPRDNFSTENAILATRALSYPLCKLYAKTMRTSRICLLLFTRSIE